MNKAVLVTQALVGAYVNALLQLLRLSLYNTVAVYQLKVCNPTFLWKAVVAAVPLQLSLDAEDGFRMSLSRKTACHKLDCYSQNHLVTNCPIFCMPQAAIPQLDCELRSTELHFTAIEATSNTIEAVSCWPQLPGSLRAPSNCGAAAGSQHQRQHHP
jgi:hypothetical protein